MAEPPRQRFSDGAHRRSMIPERWLSLSVPVPTGDPAAAAALAAELIALGGAAVEERGGRLITYVPPPADPAALVADARRRLAALDGSPAGLEWGWRDNEDWAARWRDGLRARRVGERLVIAPTWARPRPGPDDIVIALDPQMAFGTGEHASTRGSLRLLERAVRPGDRVLDVGTGSAILAIAAARLGAAEVLALESDVDAVPNARENVERNGVAETVSVVRALVDADFLAALGGARFSVISANILSGVLRPLLPAFRAAQPAGARLVLGGMLTHEAGAMVSAASRVGYRREAEDLEDDWWSALFVASDGS